MAATNINRVIITGNLTRDPELRSTGSGMAVCGLRIACNTRRKDNQTGEWVLEDQPTEKVSQEAADLFVSRVANLPAEERVMKQSAPLAPYGLLAPAAEFVATGKDGKTSGKLTLGNQAGNLLYATGQRLQGVFQVRPDILTQIPSKTDLLKKTHDKSDPSR